VKVSTRDFFIAGERSASIPDTGLTVVTGANGAGKSSLFAEPIAWCLFGKTLRGTTIKRPCSATVEIGNLTIKATRNKSAANVTFDLAGAEKAQSETATKGWKARGDLLKIDFDLWHRTHVFSIEKVAKFSAATDVERKALLENLLGLDRYANALKAAKIELTEKNAQRQAHANALNAATNSRKELETHLADLDRLVADSTEPPSEGSFASQIADLDSEIHEVEAQLAKQREVVKVRRDAKQKAVTAHAQADANLRVAKEALSRAQAAVNDTFCPTCERPYDTDHPTDHLDAAVQSAQNTLSAARTTVVEASGRVTREDGLLRDVEARLRAIEQDLMAKQSKRSRCIESRDGAVKARAAHVARVATRDAAAKRLDEARERENTAKGDFQSAAREASVLEGAALVLGPRGIRARLLDQGLRVLEDGANDALSAMGSVGRISLSSTREKSDGTIADVIDLKIEPWGGDDGYDGASGGERKRVDIALVIAASALYQPPKSLGAKLPMIFDDVFDTLDPDGVTAVASLLTSLSADRPVIVVTQNTLLADRLNASARFDLGGSV
jgi:DNA repair exonuclease SbcCD ATPase subunit